MFIMDTLPLPCFLDCCFWVMVSIPFGGILAIIGAPMRSLFYLFHLDSPFGVLFIGDGHTAIFPLTVCSIPKIGIFCQVAIRKFTLA